MISFFFFYSASVMQLNSSEVVKLPLLKIYDSGKFPLLCSSNSVKNIYHDSTWPGCVAPAFHPNNARKYPTKLWPPSLFLFFLFSLSLLTASILCSFFLGWCGRPHAASAHLLLLCVHVGPDLGFMPASVVWVWSLDTAGEGDRWIERERAVYHYIM